MSSSSGSGEIRHQQVGPGWVDVPKGMTLAVDTYVDIHGILRSSKDDSCVVWHYSWCKKTGIHASEIVYDPGTNVPWCPRCWNERLMLKADA